MSCLQVIRWSFCLLNLNLIKQKERNVVEKKYVYFGSAAFSYSAVQSLFHILTSSGQWTRKLTFGSSSQFCMQPTYGAQKYQTCTDIDLSGFQIIPWSSRASNIHFFCPEKFTSGQCRIRTTDLSIFSRTRYLWTNPPPFDQHVHKWSFKLII